KRHPKSSDQAAQARADVDDARNPLRKLPQVQRLLEQKAAEALSAEFGRAALTDALRATLEQLRAEISAGASAALDAESVLARASDLLKARKRRGLRRVINATGIVLHTNLGRAPLAAEAIEAVADVAAGYSNLEFDLESGKRGSRT